MAGGATVGTAVIKLTFDGSSVKASMNKIEGDIEKGGRSSGKRFGSSWAVAAGNLIADGIKKVGSMVTNTMGSAINRLDTLNNFPKVMTSLGYSAESADASISAIGDHLDGLPTSLDAMAGDVQKLAASMGNLADGEVNATSVGLALNDMFLAGGKGTEQASRAMEQYNQMLSRGKVDQQSWNTLLDTAPGQLNQVAQSLLGASAGQADLYKAIQEGTVSMEDMNAAIVKLDKEGGEGFESLKAQAEAATGGIATQLENISNTMNKIVAAALEGNLSDIDKYINQLASRIGGVAPTLIRGFVGAFNSLMEALPSIIKELLPVVLQGLNDLIMGLISALPDFVQLLVDALPIFMDAVVNLMQQIVEAIPTIQPQIFEALTNLVIQIALQLTRPDFLTLILQGAIQLLLGFVKAIPQVLTALISALPQIITNVVSFLLDPANLAMIIDGAIQLFLGVVMAVPQILGALIGAFGSLVGSLWDWITSKFGEFASNFGNFLGGIFKGAINGVISFIENFLNGPIDLLNGFIGIINDNFGWLGVNIGKIDRISLPRLAQGGIAYNSTIAMIGEEGKEAVLPLENNTDNWAGLLAVTLVDEMETEGIGGAGVTIEKQEFIINNEMDAQEIGRVMMQSIRRAV